MQKSQIVDLLSATTFHLVISRYIKSVFSKDISWDGESSFFNIYEILSYQIKWQSHFNDVKCNKILFWKDLRTDHLIGQKIPPNIIIITFSTNEMISP